MANNDYTPPKVWKWDSESGGKWAGVNRPIAGPTHEKILPVGDKPIQLYSLGTPNGIKITVMLEELLAMGHTDAAYDLHVIDIGKGEQFGSDFVKLNPNSKIPVILDLHVIDIGKGEQFGSDFVKLNPNSKIPVILDQSRSPAQSVFESCAILHYLAEKHDALLPRDAAERTECLSWLFWQESSASFLGGGFGHFYKYACVVPRRRLRSLLQVCAISHGIPDQPLCDGNQASTRCAGPSPGRA
jgi:GST-like protein